MGVELRQKRGEVMRHGGESAMEHAERIGYLDREYLEPLYPDGLLAKRTLRRTWDYSAGQEFDSCVKCRRDLEEDSDILLNDDDSRFEQMCFDCAGIYGGPVLEELEFWGCRVDWKELERRVCVALFLEEWDARVEV